MRNWILVVFASCSFCFSASNVQARKWMDATGAFSIEAELVRVEAGIVVLKRQNGTTLSVPIDRLSKADQAFVRRKRSTSAAKSIEEILNAKSKFNFQATPLTDVISFVKTKHGVPVYLDRRAMKGAGITLNQAISIKNSDRKLRENLDLVAKAAKLTWFVRGDVVFVTTPIQAEAMLLTRVYRIRKPGAAVPLVLNLTKNVVPRSWDGLGGSGAVAHLKQCLVISQTRPVHEQIEKSFKKDLQLVVARRRPLSKNAPSIERALALVVAGEFVDTPLKDVVKFLSTKAGQEVSIDAMALENEGLGTDSPVSLSISRAKLESIVELVAHQLHLEWITDGKKIVLTTRAAAAQKLTEASYPVRDVANVDALIQAVTSTIAPDCWEEVGGAGQVKFDVGKGLVIKQTTGKHRQIARLLGLIQLAHKR